MSNYLKTYETLCPDDQIARDDPRRSAIMAEMREIQRAKTTEEAVKAIEWWNAWPNPQHQTALEFVAEARMMLNVLLSGAGRRPLE